MYSRSHTLADLPYGISLASGGYHSRESVFDMLLCCDYAVKFLVSNFRKFYIF